MSVIIRLKNLPMSAGAADVRAFFSGLKIPDGAVHIIGGDEGEVFVGFASDEDARIAMTRHGQTIHGDEIRLLLSSKAEQNNVIAARKSGNYSSPPQDEYNPSAPPQAASQNWSGNPYAARPGGYEASYPPQNARPEYAQNNYNSRPPPQVSSAKPPSPKDDFREFGGYKGSFQNGPPPQQQSNRFAEPLKPVQPVPPVNSQVSPKHNYGYNRGPGGANGGYEPPQQNARPQAAGDSWRDNSYSQTPPSSNDFSNNKPPPRSMPPSDVPNGRKTLIPNPPFQNGPPAATNQAPLPFQARNGPPPFQNGGHPQQNRPAPSVPILPPAPEKFYIELTRLPNDLLRPAALEAFIHPSTPLTLSSVKTVFGPGGIHMHTIIRLDSIADYATMMRRNGEQGIKIQQSDRKTFDAADDTAPVPQVVVKKKEESSSSSHSRRKSRWGGGGSPRRSPRRGDRDRTRSPPARKRRRSRSPRRRDQHTDPTRWSIQVTNVPFRMKEEELIEWFSEKVKPAKLCRTYYSDGNASDRWVAEFSSESLMRRAFSIRTLCQGRTLKLSYIDNEKADEIMKIEDVYGKEKRQINEEARDQAEKANPPSFFNAPPISSGPPRAGPIPNGPIPNGPMPNGPIPNGPMSNGPPPPHMSGPPPAMRGGFMPRGNSFPPRGGMMAPPPQGAGRGQPFFPNGPPDGGFRGGFAGFRGGRGGGGPPQRGGYQGGFDMQPPPVRNEFMDLVQSLGARGTVLSCTGFPRDVTLEDVMDFFGDYEPDRNSIRIRKDEGVMTGECLLACFVPENARRAAMDLDGSLMRNSVISVRVV